MRIILFPPPIKIIPTLIVICSSLAVCASSDTLANNYALLRLTPPSTATVVNLTLVANLCALVAKNPTEQILLKPEAYEKIGIEKAKLTEYVRSQSRSTAGFLKGNRPNLSKEATPIYDSSDSSVPNTESSLTYVGCLINFGYQIEDVTIFSSVHSNKVSDPKRNNAAISQNVPKGGDSISSGPDMRKQQWFGARIAGYSDEILITGCNGLIARSRDRGKQWEMITVPGKTCVVDAYMFDDSATFLASDNMGNIWHSDNKGETWKRSKITTDESDNHRFGRIPMKFFFIDRLRGWVTTTMSYGQILMTVDGGKNWVRIRQGTRAEQLYGIWFDAKGQKGWVGGSTHYGHFGNSFVLRTLDGGSTWETIAIPEQKGRINAIEFESTGNNGWAISAGGFLLKTEDGGNQWTRQEVGKPGEEPFLAGGYLSPNRLSGCAIGHGAFVLTNEKWMSTMERRLLPFEGASVSSDGSLAIGVGYGRAFVSYNACQNWEEILFLPST